MADGPTPAPHQANLAYAEQTGHFSDLHLSADSQGDASKGNRLHRRLHEIAAARRSVPGATNAAERTGATIGHPRWSPPFTGLHPRAMSQHPRLLELTRGATGPETPVGS
jgi:hypothetical protein